MHRAFISYHHENDQRYKERLLGINDQHRVFRDWSVDTRDISDDLDDHSIRRVIRDEYLRDSTVTILLVGTETRHRKHVDWELYGSMAEDQKHEKSGILVINLPSTGNQSCIIGHGSGEKERVYPEISGWTSIDNRGELERRYPYMPERITDNLLTGKAMISVVPWAKAVNPENLRFLIHATFRGRRKCKYDLSRRMRRKNGGPNLAATPLRRYFDEYLASRPRFPYPI